MTLMKVIFAGLTVFLFGLNIVDAQNATTKPTASEIKALKRLVEKNSLQSFRTGDSHIADFDINGCQLRVKYNSTVIQPRNEIFNNNHNQQIKDSDIAVNILYTAKTLYWLDLRDLDLTTFQKMPLNTRKYNINVEKYDSYEILQENMTNLLFKSHSKKKSVIMKWEGNTDKMDNFGFSVNNEVAKQVEKEFIRIIENCQQ